MTDVQAKKTNGEKTDIRESDRNFVRSLKANQKSQSRCIYSLRRALGKHLDRIDLPTYMDFQSIAGEYIYRPAEDLYFVVATIYYYLERNCSGSGEEAAEEKEEKQTSKYVRLEELLSRLYRTTVSAEKTIQRLLKSSNAHSDAFTKQLTSLVRRCREQIKPNETLDYLALLKDLRFWDYDTRMRWARTVVLSANKPSEKKESEEEKENET